MSEKILCAAIAKRGEERNDQNSGYWDLPRGSAAWHPGEPGDPATLSRSSEGLW